MSRFKNYFLFPAVFLLALSGCANTAITPSSANADLSALALSAGTLSPSFAAGTTVYTVCVDNSVTSLTVTGTAADSTAHLSSNNGVAQSLTVGSNAITIQVTAQDGKTTKDYTVKATRATDYYTITFDPNGKTGTAYAQILKKGATANLTLMTALTSADSSFIGWSTDSSATFADYADGAIYTMGSADVKLYALWVANDVMFTCHEFFGNYYIAHHDYPIPVSLVIPSTLNGKNITGIYSDAFKNATSLVSVTIPSTVTTIHGDAFASCTSLKTLTIPSSVTFIGNFAFDSCSIALTINAVTPPVCSPDGVAGLTKVYVPKSAGSTVLAAYKAAVGWSSIAGNIFEQP